MSKNSVLSSTKNLAWPSWRDRNTLISNYTSKHLAPLFWPYFRNSWKSFQNGDLSMFWKNLPAVLKWGWVDIFKRLAWLLCFLLPVSHIVHTQNWSPYVVEKNFLSDLLIIQCAIQDVCTPADWLTLFTSFVNNGNRTLCHLILC